MRESCDIVVIGSGFAGSLVARVLTTLGRDVLLLERGSHPRFAIGESSTPQANLSLERLAVRYGFADCYRLATHGRWLAHFPELRRGLKRGFTFYRHHPGQPFANRGLDSERLLVAASPNDALSDTHWLRADVDHHFVQQAVAAGADYRDGVELTHAEIAPHHVRISGSRDNAAFELHAQFVIDATGAAGFLARQLAIPSALDRTATRSALLFSHFAGARPMREVAPGLPDGPYPDDWAAVHHLLDEGWMYSLRFDDGLTSAGFLLTPRGTSALGASTRDPQSLWKVLLDRYPTLASAFADAEPLFPLVFRPRVQHRLARAAGKRWALLPHAYAFVDPLFSTGIAWSLRATERLGRAFESIGKGKHVPALEDLARYDTLLGAEADQIDTLVAGAYHAMADFDLFEAQAMLYFAAVSFAETRQRLLPEESAAWSGFLGVGDEVLQPLPRAALRQLAAITGSGSHAASATERRDFVRWITHAIAPRNVAGLAEASRHRLYPVDLDVLIDRHQLLGLTRDQLSAALPALRGMSPEPVFAGSPSSAADRSTSRSARRSPAPGMRAPR